MDEDREELPEVFGRRSVRQRAAAKVRGFLVLVHSSRTLN